MNVINKNKMFNFIWLKKKLDFSILTLLLFGIAGNFYLTASATPVTSISNSLSSNKINETVIIFVQEALSKGDFPYAKNLLSVLKKDSPDNVHVDMNMAVYYETVKKISDAEIMYNQVLVNDPENYIARYRLALIYDYQGKTELALNYLNNYIKNYPYNYYAYYILGNISASKNNLDEAISYTTKAIQLNPNFAEGYNNICYCKALKGNYLDAFSDCSTALSLNPESPEILDSMGFIYYNLHQYDKAFKYYKKAIELNSSISEIYLHLADTLDKMDKKKEAAICRDKYLIYELKYQKKEKRKNILKSNSE